MLPDISGSLVHVRYISLLQDFSAIGTYSWDRRSLSLTTDLAWSHIPVLRPQIVSRHHTRVYIRNPTNCDTRTVGYQLTGTSMLQEVDDMATRVIQGPPSSPTQSSRRWPREPVPNRGALGVKRGAHRLPGRGARDERPPVPPFPRGREHADPGHEVERGEGSGGHGHVHGNVGVSHYVDPFDSPGLDMPAFSLCLTPFSQSFLGGSGTLRAPPPSG
ncbi:hypothetical protein M9H77_04060 [Catharanthus roseus]|uniref:Uncharacterized protein n=1 Tax=Catharanthus roseus TaxID=4058 RepID=A0ACC0CD82_CATRO|nr:hypothetical protein M9H77_04060 [Catharanthus roseus]